MVDIHLHSSFSHDSDEVQENYIKRAIGLGESTLGFSEHYDYDAVLQGDDLPLADCTAYKNNLYALSRKYQKITLLYGIELGYSKQAESRYKKLIADNSFDYVICSVHSLPQYGDFYHGRAFEGRTVKEAYNDYFNAVLESVKSDLDFQIVGHIGYCERYCPFPNSEIRYVDYAEIIDEILKEIIRRDKCLEINTSTGGKGGFLPETAIIKRYIQLGGKALSFASDAHSADKYLRGCDIVTDFLKECGIFKLRYYKDKRPIEYNI